MTKQLRKSRVGFAVIKLRLSDQAYYLMRFNAKWKDINFIGGHEKPRDGGDLKKTTGRELWEEVPSIRSYSDFYLKPLTEELRHGPIYSRSKGDMVEYSLQFFLLHIEHSPVVFIEALSLRTKNIWISERELLRPQKYRFSGLVGLLDGVLSGGLGAIAYSNEMDVSFLNRYFDRNDGSQLEFSLK